MDNTVEFAATADKENTAVDCNRLSKFHVSNLDLYYNDFHALKDINIDIPENQITAFIGDRKSVV